MSGILAVGVRSKLMQPDPRCSGPRTSVQHPSKPYNAAVKDRHNAPAAAKAIVSNSHIPSTLHSPTASAPRPPPQNRPPPQPRPPALPKPPKPPRDGPVHMHRKGITCYACVAQREERAAAKLRPPPLPFSQPPIADITVHTPQGVQREPQLQLPFNAEQPQIPDANSIIEAHTTPLEGKIEQDPPSSLFSDYTVDPSLPHPAPSHDIDQDNAAFASQQSPDHSIADSPIPHIDGTPLNIPFAMQVPPNGAASAPAVSLPAAALYNTPSKQALAASRDAGPSSPAPSSWPQPTVRSPYKWHNARPDTTLPASLHEWRGVLEQEGISTFESLRHISPHFVDRYVKDLSIVSARGIDRRNGKLKTLLRM